MSMKIYYPQLPVSYCADLHLGHGNIMLYCGRTEFMDPREREMYGAWKDAGEPRDKKPYLSRETVRRHDDCVIANINDGVPRDAILVIVGDVLFGPKNDFGFFEAARRYREAIQCKNIHVVWGNHDRPWIKEFSSLFTWANEKVTVVVRGHDCSKFRRASDVVLDHEAHFFWDGRHKGARHYYGHTHARGEEELDRVMPGRFSMDVGIDNAFRLTGKYRPFSDVELEKIMTSRPGYGAYSRDGHRGNDE